MFTTNTRDNGTTYVTLSDDAPEWLRHAVREAHDDELPNDWRFATCESIWDAFTTDQGYSLTSPTDREYVVRQINESDPATTSYFRFYAEYPSRYAYADAHEEANGGTDYRPDSFATRATDGRGFAIREMVYIIAEAIIEAYESYVDECEAEGLDAHDLHMWAVHNCPTGPIG